MSAGPTGAGPQASLLPDQRRLHLNHGPIDLIIEVFGADRRACYAQAVARFETILTELVAELPALRRPVAEGADFSGRTARRMQQATRRFDGVFITPMAAVAGAVADEMLAATIAGHEVPKACVNNGGDVAFHLTPGESAEALGAAGPVVIGFADRPRGLATSGWRGRSHSLGIADAVTVAARNAATADAAATLIANAVDLPGHPAIRRAPACELSPDSDLGARLVTTDVGPLTPAEAGEALEAGAALARSLIARGLIDQVSLTLAGQTLIAAADNAEKEPSHA
ncbi:UPF0280 family protein [Rhodobacteraceae bacterium NNCM2]|nr:UPF0280 family protein [Coraliihabitans acroporae]